jgi:hypothetical protein
MSRLGRQDGLNWEGEGQPLIPAGLARAAGDGAAPVEATRSDYFRVLKGQGPNAPRGTHEYLVKSKLLGGFGLVAGPAECGITGIRTFMVHEEGVVYENDIAPSASSDRTLRSRSVLGARPVTDESGSHRRAPAEYP